METNDLKELKGNLFFNIITIFLLVLLLTINLYGEPIETDKLLGISKFFSYDSNRMLMDQTFWNFLDHIFPLLMTLLAVAVYNLVNAVYISNKNSRPLPRIMRKFDDLQNVVFDNKRIVYISIIIYAIIQFFLMQYPNVINLFVLSSTWFIAVIIFIQTFCDMHFGVRWMKKKTYKVIVISGVFTVGFIILSFFDENKLTAILVGIVILMVYKTFNLVLTKSDPVGFVKLVKSLKRWIMIFIIIFLITQGVSFWELGICFCFLLAVLRILISLIKLIGYLLINEHKIANQEKQDSLNQDVITTLIALLPKSEQQVLKGMFLGQLNNREYTIHRDEGFTLFINDLKIDPTTRKRIDIVYKEMILDHSETSKKLGNIVKYRNRKNMLIPILIILTIFVIEGLLKFYNISHDLRIDTFRKVVYAIIFYRFITRFIEIGIAFYLDIKPTHKIKNTDLSSNDRVALVLNSLIEITLLASILYFEFKLIDGKIKGFDDVLLIFVESFKYATAVAFFNVSYPLNLETGIPMFNDLKLWSILNTTYFVHLIQLLMSVLLISLSINAYGSKNFKKSSYRLKQQGKNIHVIEVLYNEDTEREVLPPTDPLFLEKVLKEKWESNELDTASYSEVLDLIDFSWKKR